MVEIIKLDSSELNNYVKSLILKRFRTVSDIEQKFEKETDLTITFKDNRLNNHEQAYDYSLSGVISYSRVGKCVVELFYVLDNDNKILVTDAICELNI